MQFVIGVSHEIVQTLMHVNVGITSSYMWSSHGCALFIHTNILVHQLLNFFKNLNFMYPLLITIEKLFYGHYCLFKMINFLVED